MKRAITIISAAALTVTAMGAAIAPASAASLHSYNNQQQHHSYQPTHKQQPRFERHGDYAYFNGQKGYKQRHAGYRYYNGYWFPVAAFVGFAIIGGILSQLAH